MGVPWFRSGCDLLPWHAVVIGAVVDGEDVGADNGHGAAAWGLHHGESCAIRNLYSAL